MLRQLLEQAGKDEPVYITDVRKLFNQNGEHPFSLLVTLYDDSTRFFDLRLPDTHSEEEKQLVSAYLYAMVYNILSSLGGVCIDIYTDLSDPDLLRLAESLPEVFQSGVSKTDRSGYGKCMNVNDRVLKVLTDGRKQFSFRIHDASEARPERPRKLQFAGMPVFADLPGRVKNRMILGIDVGGTDIKLAASVNGRLAVCKEYDWFPTAFGTAGQMITPILQLVRLMRSAACLIAQGKEESVIFSAFHKEASDLQIEEAIGAMESSLEGKTEGFDAIGLSFPDVVIRNLIVGGECYKFKGMRDNPDLDFEQQFAKVTVLCELLKEYTKDGVVMNTNDGPMAAFTAAVEMAPVGAAVKDGFFAHTLGTELGTGWVQPDGSIPEIPLEVYNFIIDLGSFLQKGFPPEDVRSINNFNTGLPGTLQKYTSQYGVFRLAAKHLPDEDPAVWQEATDQGLFLMEADSLKVPVEPKDMRKPCLEFFMQKAADPSHPACGKLFERIGEYLAVCWEETDYILEPGAKDRSLFGRLVKVPACFAQMKQGAAARVPSLHLYAADSNMANTPLMKQLDSHPDYTVAQFAQAVGAVYFACLGLPD